jgi:hypothetical protein
MTLTDIAFNIAWTVTLLAVLLLIVSAVVEEKITGPIMEYKGKYDILFRITGTFLLLTPFVWVAAAIIGIWS